MTCETILYQEDGGIGPLTLDRPDDGELFMRRRCSEVRDCVDDVGRDTRTRVPMDTGATPFLCPRCRVDGCVVTHVGELPSVPAFGGEACRFDPSRQGGVFRERRP